MASKTSVIERIEAGERELRVWLSGRAKPLELPWFWVRDHSQDPTSTDPDTMQRTVDSFAIDPDIRPAACQMMDDEIHVNWADGEAPSVLSAALLKQAAVASGVEPSAAASRVLWHASQAIGADPMQYSMQYADVMDSDDALLDWLQGVHQFGFGLVTGSPTDIPSAEALVNRVGYIRRTIFGDMWTLSSDLVDHADSAYSTTYLEPHTDGTYSHDGPGLQLFACVDRTGTGGDSVLLDGFAAAELLRVEQPDAFELLTTVSVPAHYIEAGVELRAIRPTIRLAADGSVEQVTFNNYDRSAFLLPADRLRSWYRAYGALHDLIIDQARWWTHRLEPGDTLLFDNWRCLHGRLAYTGTRKFHGCYLNHEDLESKLRVLN